MSNKFKYEVALSFAGEDRVYVEKVAEILKENKVNVFYDNSEDLWGQDLIQKLHNIYQNISRYTIIFISENYVNKLWARHELRSAQARAFLENEEYILPVRFDDTNVPGLPNTIGYEDARKLSPKQLSEKILNKLKKINPIKEPQLNDDDDIEIIRIKRKISDFEKDSFLSESFKYLQNYFLRGLKKLEAAEPDIKFKLEEINIHKFVAKIYIQGDLKSICKIWMDSGSSDKDIKYADGINRLNSLGDNSYNDSATLKDDGKEIFFQISSMGYGMFDHSIDTQRASAKDVSAYFWKRFLKNIN